MDPAKPARPRLWQVGARVLAAREMSVCALFESRFGAAAVYQDADTGALTVSAYVAELGAAPAALRRQLAGDLSVHPRDIFVRLLPREDWATSWKRHFQPIVIGSQLLIKPSWSRRRARPGQRVLILDPGLSFGTGQHETTAYCLRHLCALMRRSPAPASFLDIGTGSGILALAAAKLGCKSVEAFDFDPDAVRAARANARRNRVDTRIRFRRADLTTVPLPRRRFGLICANLTYDLLASQAGRISRLLTPGGSLIVAGILTSQFHIVTKSFQRFDLTLVESDVSNNWRSGQFAFHGLRP